MIDKSSKQFGINSYASVLLESPSQMTLSLDGIEPLPSYDQLFASSLDYHRLPASYVACSLELKPQLHLVHKIVFSPNAYNQPILLSNPRHQQPRPQVFNPSIFDIEDQLQDQEVQH